MNYMLIYLQVRGGVPGSLYVLCPVDIAQLAQAEAIPSWWIHVAIHSHYRTCGWHLKRLPNLDIHLKVRNGAPVFWSWNKPTSNLGSNGLHRLCLRCGLSSICSLILTRVIGYGGLERNFIGNRPCKNMSIFLFNKQLWSHSSYLDIIHKMSGRTTVTHFVLACHIFINL